MDSCCVGGRHRSTSIKIVGDITSKRSNVIFGHCSICNREQCMTVSENTIATKSLDDFSKNLGKKGVIVSRKMAKNDLKSPGRALEIEANVGTAFASRSLQAALTSLPEVINF